MILKSWRVSTLNQYITYAKLWFDFARQGLQPTIQANQGWEPHETIAI